MYACTRTHTHTHTHKHTHTHTHTQGEVPPTDTKPPPPLGSDMAPLSPLTAGVPVLPGMPPEVCVHAEGVSSEGVWWGVCVRKDVCGGMCA